MPQSRRLRPEDARLKRLVHPMKRELRAAAVVALIVLALGMAETAERRTASSKSNRIR